MGTKTKGWVQRLARPWKHTNLLVQLSIFLIDLFVGTYRLSSHARLEAFVIQTKQRLARPWKHRKKETKENADKVDTSVELARTVYVCTVYVRIFD